MALGLALCISGVVFPVSIAMSDFLDGPAGRNAIDKHAAALTAAQHRIVVIQFARRDVDLPGGGSGLARVFIVFTTGNNRPRGAEVL